MKLRLNRSPLPWIVAVLALWGLHAQAARLSNDQATLLLAQAVSRDAGYAVPGGASCLQFVLETSDKRFVELAVRAKSDAPCQGGDAFQAPVLDRFRVSRAKGTIERQASDGAFVPYTEPPRPRT